MAIKSLKGKTILSVTRMKKFGCSDDGFLKLEFTDRTSCLIVAEYGSYCALAYDEYPTRISITTKKHNLVKSKNQKLRG